MVYLGGLVILQHEVLKVWGPLQDILADGDTPLGDGEKGRPYGQGYQEQRHLVLDREPVSPLLLAKDALQVVAGLPLVSHHPGPSVAYYDEQEDDVVVVRGPGIEELELLDNAVHRPRAVGLDIAQGVSTRVGAVESRSGFQLVDNKELFGTAYGHIARTRVYSEMEAKSHERSTGAQEPRGNEVELAVLSDAQREEDAVAVLEDEQERLRSQALALNRRCGTRRTGIVHNHVVVVVVDRGMVVGDLAAIFELLWQGTDDLGVTDPRPKVVPPNNGS